MAKPLVLPKPQDACPCGSTQAFSECCQPHLPGFDIRKPSDAARRRRDLAAGLVATRADLAQYVIWHRTNTAPAMRAGLAELDEMVLIDMACIASYAERVLEMLWRNDRAHEIGPTIERLREHVNDRRWRRKITYLHAWAAWLTGDEQRALVEFEKLGPLTKQESDLDVLRTGMALLQDKLSFARTLQICDRVLELSDDLEDQLRYRGIKATRYFIHGDPDQAKEELQIATKLDDDIQDTDLYWIEQFLLGWCLTYLAYLSHDKTDFDRALALYNVRLANARLEPSMRATVHEELASLYRYVGRAAEAEAAYRTALEHGQSVSAQIFLAEMVLVQGRIQEADDLIAALEPAKMETALYEDYVFVFAAVALALGEQSRLAMAGQRLRASRGAAPYFEHRRLAFLVAVEDAIKSGADVGFLDRVRQLLASPVRALNRYVMLEPNVGGIGLRVNNMLEDAARHRSKKR